MEENRKKTSKRPGTNKGVLRNNIGAQYSSLKFSINIWLNDISFSAFPNVIKTLRQYIPRNSAVNQLFAGL